MEAMREQWSDNRLDDLNQKTDKRFEAVEGGLATQRDEMTEAVNRLDGKIEKQTEELNAMRHTMLQGVIALSGSFMVGFAALAGLIATQL